MLNGRTEVKDKEVNTAIFKPITRLNSGEKNSFCSSKNNAARSKFASMIIVSEDTNILVFF